MVARDFVDDRFLPRLQLGEEIGLLVRVHEFFGFGRTIVVGKLKLVEFLRARPVKVLQCGRHTYLPDTRRRLSEIGPTDRGG